MYVRLPPAKVFAAVYAPVSLIVELPGVRVNPVAVVAVQGSRLPFKVQVPLPMVRVRVFELDEEKAPAVTAILLASNLPAVSVNVLVEVTLRASASWTVFEELMVRDPANGTPFEVSVEVTVVEVLIKLSVPV